MKLYLVWLDSWNKLNLLGVYDNLHAAETRIEEWEEKLRDEKKNGNKFFDQSCVYYSIQKLNEDIIFPEL